MLWFKDKKGLATGLAVAGFGAAKAIASPIMQKLLGNNQNGEIYKMFWILAVVYFVMMFVGHLLLAKPADWHEPQTKSKDEGIMATLKREPITSYIGIWLMFYLNITCGLALISQEKMIVKCIGLASFVGIISTISAIFNAGGRLGFSAWAFAGLSGNQLANFIVSKSGEWIEVHGVNVNPTGYQNVLYVTLALYVVSLCLSLFLVRPTKKDK